MKRLATGKNILKNTFNEGHSIEVITAMPTFYLN
jgi:hypothetical protein